MMIIRDATDLFDAMNYNQELVNALLSAQRLLQHVSVSGLQPMPNNEFGERMIQYTTKDGHYFDVLVDNDIAWPGVYVVGKMQPQEFYEGLLPGYELIEINSLAVPEKPALNDYYHCCVYRPKDVPLAEIMRSAA